MLATTTPVPSGASGLSVAPSPFSKTDWRQTCRPSSRATNSTPRRSSTSSVIATDAAVEQHRRRAARAVVLTAPDLLQGAVRAGDEPVQRLVGDDVGPRLVRREPAPHLLAEVGDRDLARGRVDRADQSLLRGPPDAAGPVGGDRDEAVAVGDVGLEVPRGRGGERRARPSRTGSRRRAPRGCGWPRRPGRPRRRTTGRGRRRRRTARRRAGRGSTIGRIVSASTRRRLGPDRSTQRASSGPAEVASRRPHRWRPNHAVSTSGCRPSGPGTGRRRPTARWGLAGASAGPVGVRRRRAPDVRRPGERPGCRRDRQPAVRDDEHERHQGEDDGAGQAGRATLDVGAVLDPPADARHAEERRRDDEDDRSPGEPGEQERADQPDHRATLGERDGSSAQAQRCPRDAWVTRASGDVSVDGEAGSRRGEGELGERAVALAVAQEDARAPRPRQTRAAPTWWIGITSGPARAPPPVPTGRPATR